jgi:hypothetical protein
VRRVTIAEGFNLICGPQHDYPNPKIGSVDGAIKVLEDLLAI